MFHMNTVPPSSVSKSKLSNLLLVGPLLSLFFNPENGDDIFSRNLGQILPNYTASYPRGWDYS
jgi:hypothetical protein